MAILTNYRNLKRNKNNFPQKKQEPRSSTSEVTLYHDINNESDCLLDGSKKAYFREFKKLLEVADVILEVLDARDPLGSRCHEIEQAIMKKDSNKKIILILNKIGTLVDFQIIRLHP